GHVFPKTQSPISWAEVPPLAEDQAVYPDTPDNSSRLRITERLPGNGAHIAGVSVVGGISVVRQISESHAALTAHVLGGINANSFVEQYFDRLMLNILLSDSSAAAQLDPHISEWAIFFDDPTLITGSAVAIVARVRDVQAVMSWLKWAREYATRMHSTVTVGEWSHLGIPVQHYRSGEMGRDQHLAIDKDVVYLANSRGLLQRILSVKAGTDSLLDSAEYRFMSSQVSAHNGGHPYIEFFAGQRFWSRSFAPRERIAIWRREAARADMQQLSATALLYRWLQGNMPANQGEMTRLGILAEDEVQHNGGQHITYDPDQGVSSNWGTLAFLTPVADIDVSVPTVVEANAYKKFRADLGSTKPRPPVFFGRIHGGLEPTVQLAYVGRGEEPGVQRIVGMCKSAVMEVPDLPDTVQVSVGLAKGTGLYRAIAAMLPEGLEPLEWIGSTVTFGIRIGSTQEQLMSGWDTLLKAPMAWLYSHRVALMSAPSYVIFDVSDVVALTTMLTDIRRLLQAQGETDIAYSSGPIYEFIPSVRVTGTTPGNGFEWNLYYALAGNRLVITPAPEVLESILHSARGKNRRVKSLGLAGLNVHASWTKHPGKRSLFRAFKNLVPHGQRQDYVDLDLVPGVTGDAIRVWTGSPFLTTSDSDTSAQADPWSEYMGRFDGIGVSVRVDPADIPARKPLVVQVNARWSMQ
ncbi:MAG: hypothetical protein VX223_16155, partial [Myxococcota bacterium]|nr:hypothetical protein [Myxococcota bacterium]